jgi:hypothetical protein
MALFVGAVIDYQCHENPHRIDEAEPGVWIWPAYHP